MIKKESRDLEPEEKRQEEEGDEEAHSEWEADHDQLPEDYFVSMAEFYETGEQSQNEEDEEQDIIDREDNPEDWEREDY